MKNATKHAEKLKSLVRTLLKEAPAPAVPPGDPLKTLVRAAMMYDVPDSRADEAMKLIEAEFVDLNELRVATELEVQELLGQRYPAIEKRVEMITRALNAIFEREHTLSLDRLRSISKRDARQFLRELPDIHPFVEAYVMLFAFDGNAVPLDDHSLVHLREAGVLEEDATLDAAQRFVEHNLKGEQCKSFFLALRKAVYEEGKKKKDKEKEKVRG